MAVAFDTFLSMAPRTFFACAASRDVLDRLDQSLYAKRRA
jgi:hypothetical protein